LAVFTDLKVTKRRHFTIGGVRYTPEQKPFMRNIVVALAILTFAHLVLYRRAERRLGFRR
jgi:hypothetical protein